MNDNDDTYFGIYDYCSQEDFDNLNEDTILLVKNAAKTYYTTLVLLRLVVDKRGLIVVPN